MAVFCGRCLRVRSPLTFDPAAALCDNPPKTLWGILLTTRILFISSYSGLGGGETALVALAAHLKGYEVHLLVPHDGAFAAAWRNIGGVVHLAAFRGASVVFVPSLWAHFPIRYQIARLIREQHIDVVHTEYHALPFALPAAESAGIPCLWTCMGWWFHPQVWQRAFFKRASATFAHSQAIQRGFLGNPPFMPPDALEVLYPGVDTVRFSPQADGHAVRAELGIAPDVPLVALVARFQDVKGHDTFLQMAAQVRARLPAVQFIVAGENLQSAQDADYKRRILALLDTLQLTPAVHYLGHRSDVEHKLAAADVVVCPSHFEGFGMVNVEAMACGKPVVSTNHGGPSEVVIDGETGYLVPPKDPAALAERVIALLYSPNTRRTFGAAGRLRALQVFSADQVAARFATTVHKLTE